MAAPETYDLLVVGGGINGAGIARDAAGRGLRVAIAERDDLGQHTSSASTKLIHGGLRYLEQGAIRLVRESLAEREVLMRIAPHLVRPQQFVIAPTPHARPAWMMRAGLFLYDRLGGRSTLPRSRSIDLDRDARGEPLLLGGTCPAYWDGWVDDSRLVLLNLVDAAARGCAVFLCTEMLEALRRDGEWLVRLRLATGEREVRAKALVNATGPWVSQVALRIGSARPPRPIRLVKGSHIILPRLYAGDHAYLLQAQDKRVVFAIPYLDDFTLVGTTDVPVQEPDRAAAISPEETGYLLEVMRQSFRRSLSADDVIASFAGVRPLQDDGSGSASAVTRDYALELDSAGPPLVSVIGGKLTTYRRLAEKVLSLLAPLGGDKRAWTATAVLPGGDAGGRAPVLRLLQQRYPALPEALLGRLAGSYGDRSALILGDARELADLGVDFGETLFQREVDYLVTHEWAVSADDILWRRTKLGYRLDGAATVKLADYLNR